MTAARAAGAARRAATSSVALGLLVALLTWDVVFGYPGGGLDPSWGGGLYRALHDGLDFGTDVVFTYGPLGFLFEPVNWYVGLAGISFLWNALLHVALAIGLVWAIRRNAGPWVAAVGAFLALAVLRAVDVPLALAALLSFAALRADPPRHGVDLLVFAGAPFAAVQILEKINFGPPILAMFILALAGTRARPRQWLAFGGLFAFSLLVLWIASGQPVGALGDYLSNGRQIVSGYSEAMASFSGIDFGVVSSAVVAFAVMLGLIVAAALSDQRDHRARVCATLLMFAAAFPLFKEGVVRADAGHLSTAFATPLFFLFALPWPPRRRNAGLAGAVVLLALGIVTLTQAYGYGARDILDRVDPSDDVRSAGTAWADLFQTGERSTGRSYSRVLLAGFYGLPERMRERVDAEPVSIDPSEIAAAWAYDFNWDPLPVFQNYSAYTVALDELNADAVASEDGPRMILRRAATRIVGGEPGGTVDDRFTGWDPPAQAIATLCHFDPVMTSPKWQLLSRVPDRCDAPRPIASVESSWGETVRVPRPKPGEVVFVRIHGAEVRGLEKFRALAYRAVERRAVVDGERGYRLVPGTAADGLLLRGPRRIVGAPPFAQAPQARTLELTGRSGGLRYDFYAMRVHTDGGTRGG